MQKVLILMDMPLFPYRIYAYNGLADRGYDLTVVSVSNEDAKYDIPLKFKHIRMSKKMYGGFVKLKNFGTINPDAYDIIVVDPNLRMLDFYRFYRKKYWDKLIGWGHHKGRTTGNKLAEWVRWSFFTKFRALVFYDYETRKEYVEHGFDADRLFVANNTQYVDLSMVDLKAKRNSFIYVGRIQERKAIDKALEAFAIVKQKTKDTDLIFKVVGGGDASQLKELCKQLEIEESVVFTGTIHDEHSLADIFNNAYGYVSPGHVGLGVLHGLAFGVPVITCTGRKHSLEVVNCKPVNSFLVDFDKQSIADAMLKLCTDVELFGKMSLSAHDYDTQFCTIDKMVDGVDDAIKYLTK